MRQYILPGILLLSLLFSACKSEQRRFNNRMEGTWNIANETIVQIMPDGSTQVTSDTDNAGTLIIEEDDFELGKVFMNYSLSLTTSNFNWTQEPFKTDEERKRVFLYYFYCEDLFGCDMIATIEEDKPNRQVWNFFRQDGSVNGVTVHRKVTWTLEKD